MLAQGENEQPDESRERHADEKRADPRPGAADQDLVHEQLGEHRNDDAGQHQHQTEQHDERQPGSRSRELAPQDRQGLRRAALAAEFGGLFKSEDDPGEAFGKLLERDPAPPEAGIVDVGPPAANSLEDNKMVEVPVDDRRPRQLFEPVWLLFKPLGRETVLPRGLDEVARLAAVAGDPASQPQLLKRYPGAVIGEYHCQRSGAALDGFHLENRRRRSGLAAGQAEPSRQGAGIEPPPAVGGRRVGHSPRLVVCRSSGSTRLIGACRCTVISAVAVVPLDTCTGGPLPADQA